MRVSVPLSAAVGLSSAWSGRGGLTRFTVTRREEKGEERGRGGEEGAATDHTGDEGKSRKKEKVERLYNWDETEEGLSLSRCFAGSCYAKREKGLYPELSKLEWEGTARDELTFSFGVQ